MPLPNEADLAAWARKREESIYNRLLLNRVFQGIVTGIVGIFPNLQVQIVKTGETTSDDMTYPVVSNWEPVIGDVVDIIWQDDTAGLAAFPISSAAKKRLPARHPYVCRLYHNTSFSLTAGWTRVGYDSIDFDPYAMCSNSDVLIPVDGVYLCVVRNGATPTGGPLTIDTTAGLYWRPVGGAFGIIAQGSRSTAGFAESTLTAVRFLSKGDALNGYIYVGGNGTGQFGSYLNYMEVCLLSRIVR